MWDCQGRFHQDLQDEIATVSLGKDVSGKVSPSLHHDISILSQTKDNVYEVYWSPEESFSNKAQVLIYEMEYF